MITGQQILFKTPLNPSSGYGRDGIQLASGMEQKYAEVHLDPRNVGVPLPEDVAYMLTRSRPKHFDLALQHDYPGALNFPKRLKEFADHIVGWTMYEFLGFGNEIEMTDKLEQRLESYDLLLAYDGVTKEAFKPYIDENKIKIIQGGYDSEFWVPKDEEYGYREWDGTFIFIMNGTMNRRKNPFAAIDAFSMLKDEYGDAFDAELHLKTTSAVLHPAMMDHNPWLKIICTQWTPYQLKHFYLRSHCLLAPSWGEGKNLPALEAQTTGMPVIVSDFGGHKQWASDDISYLVGGPLEEHAPGQASMRVDVEKLAETMWYVYNHRAEARLKGERASKQIPSMCDWSVVIDRLKFYLEQHL